MTAKAYMENFANGKGWWDIGKACQAYIIALGANDINSGIELGTISDICKEDYTQNAKTFAGYYAQIIQRIKMIQPRAKIFLVTLLKHGNEKDEKRKQMRDLLEQISEFFNRTYLLDMYTYAPVQDEKYNKIFS